MALCTRCHHGLPIDWIARHGAEFSEGPFAKIADNLIRMREDHRAKLLAGFCDHPPA
jgi:hypothetical protein